MASVSADTRRRWLRLDSGPTAVPTCGRPEWAAGAAAFDAVAAIPQPAQRAMEYGYIFGHGAYIGPDYTADALRRSAFDVLDQYGARPPTRPCARAREDFKTNHYDAATGTQACSAAQ